MVSEERLVDEKDKPEPSQPRPGMYRRIGALGLNPEWIIGLVNWASTRNVSSGW